VLTLYRPGNGLFHRMPAGVKIVLLLAVVLAISLWPPSLWASAGTGAVCMLGYAIAGLPDGMLGMRELGRQILAIRWLIVVTAAGQLIFNGPLATVENTTRVAVAVTIAGLLALTTKVTALLDAVERALSPLRHLGLDPQRVALLFSVTLTTLPVLIRLAGDVREAQRARGAPARLRTFVVPYLVVALKHADELGEALAARGVR